MATTRVAGYTLDYAAPEVLAVEQKRVTPAADLYSMGLELVLLDLHLSVLGCPRPRPQLDAAGLRAALAPAGPEVARPLCGLLETLLASNPSERGSASIALAHEYFADVAAWREAEAAQRGSPYLNCCLCLERF